MDKRYMRRLKKKLQCSASRRKEIVRQLASEVEARAAQGESEAEVLHQMGAPEEIAAEFNNTFSGEEKRKHRIEKWGKIALVIVCVLAVLAGGIYWALPKTVELEKNGVFQEEALKKRSEEIAVLVYEEDYETLKGYADRKLQEFLDGDELQAAKDGFGKDWGEFQSYGAMYLAQVRQMGKTSAVAQFNVAYENVSVTYTLVYNDKMQITGLWMK